MVNGTSILKPPFLLLFNRGIMIIVVSRLVLSKTFPFLSTEITLPPVRQNILHIIVSCQKNDLRRELVAAFAISSRDRFAMCRMPEGCLLAFTAVETPASTGVGLNPAGLNGCDGR